ncbi:hypothetical protein Lal_00024199 [Lupinus albus]|nr:hypothetical protein Lal_00024199 [Lupinus albus]
MCISVSDTYRIRHTYPYLCFIDESLKHSETSYNGHKPLQVRFDFNAQVSAYKMVEILRKGHGKRK